MIAPNNKKIVVTTDMMNEGVHFDLGYSSALYLGFKLVSVNVSDIMAMGCVPKYLFLDLAFNPEADEELFDGIYNGIHEAVLHYGVSLLGGDLCSSRNDTVLVATVMGEGDRVVFRRGAMPGDRIYLTSSTGDSGCGLQILKRLDADSRERVRMQTGLREPAVFTEPDLKLQADSGSLVSLGWKTGFRLIKRHLAPLARDSKDMAAFANAMLDISDGLFIDLTRLCDESGTGAIIYADQVPVSPELAEASELLGMDALKMSVSGGEDYEIIFTSSNFPLEAYNASHDIKVSCIGEITQSERTVIDKDGKRSPLAAAGYEHFGH